MMNKLLKILLILVFPIATFANPLHLDHEGDDDKKKKKKSKSEVRAERKVALTFDGGWNTIGACGIMGSYYVNPRVGIDAGFGIGVKGPKLGIRGKYMLSTKNFAPFVGLGISNRFWNSDPETSVDDVTGESLTYEINNVLYVQPAIGFEFMSNGGFVFGMATGYSIATSDSYKVISGDYDDLETGFDLLWGNGIILSMNIGYAF